MNTALDTHFLSHNNIITASDLLIYRLFFGVDFLNDKIEMDRLVVM